MAQEIKAMATLAVERKGISLETATEEIQAIYNKHTTAYKRELALRHYMEDHTHPNHEGSGGKTGVDNIEKHLHTKE